MSAVLLVWTPGVEPAAFAPLREALLGDGHRVEVVAFPCSGDAETLARSLERRIAAEPVSPVVVAHGVGATVAVLAAQRIVVRGLVLLGPVLDSPGHAAAAAVAGAPVGLGVDLSRPAPWGGHPDLRELVLGEGLPDLGCFPAGLARDLAAWVGPDRPPLEPDRIRAPVWVGVGLYDELAPLEVVVPAARELSAHVERLGIGGLDGRDFDHVGLLVSERPVAAAVRAVSELAR